VSTFVIELGNFFAILNCSFTVQVAFAWYFVENIFSNGIRFDLRESVVDVSFLNAYVNWRFVQWRWSDILCQKRLLCRVTVAKRSLFVIQLPVWTK